MNENEDRIWDVLIEDAMREQGASELPHEPGDYTRRLLTPVGPVGVDRGRSMRYTRPRWITFAAWAVAVTLVCAILYAGAVLLPKLSEANRSGGSDPTSAGTNQAPQDEGNAPPAPAPQPSPEPQPEPKDNSAPDTAPDDGGEPEPKPDDSDEQPRPEPTPEPKPDDSVEQPKPEPKPDDSVKEPTPEPKPDDTVEQPKQPENTTPGEEPTLVLRLLNAEKRSDLLVATELDKDSGKPAFRAAGNQTEFENESWLSCGKPVDIDAGGVLIRLRGQARVKIRGASVLDITLVDDDLFFDSRGSRRSVNVEAEDSRISAFDGSAVLVELRSSSADVSVYRGEAFANNDVGGRYSLPEGKKATIREHARTTFKDIKGNLSEQPYLKGLLDRTVYREDFDAEEVPGRLREGNLEDGAVSGNTVFWGYPENIQYQPGLVIRMRVRFTNVTACTVTQFCKERNDNYSYELKEQPSWPRELRNDQWFVLELEIDQFLERTEHEGHPQSGESFMNVSIKTEGENALVELDWVELIRAVK